MDVFREVTKEQIEMVCGQFSDSPRLTMEVARLRKMKVNGVAWKHLSYFLDGPGPRQPMNVDLLRLWREDTGVRRRVTMTILYELRWNYARYGRLNVAQSVFEVEDWRLALGAFQMNWSLLPSIRIRRVGMLRFAAGPLVRIWFNDVYDWHPEDKQRPTQCVHEAAQKLVEMGKAATYRMTGSAEVVLERYDLR